MDKKKLDSLRDRMKRHGTLDIGDESYAVVVLSARELQELLDLAEKALSKPG
jgi:hypothetical protein